MFHGELSFLTLLVLLCQHGVKAADLKAADLITCEGETASLTCSQGTILVISANYGRTDSTTCSSGKPAGPPSNGTINVLSANSGRTDRRACPSRRPANQLSNVQCTQSTSLSVLSTLCDGMLNCSIVVGNAAFTDPCLGTYKYLKVSFECILPLSEPTTDLITCVSGTARLSCDRGTVNVLSANYGRTDSSTCSIGRPANQLSNVQCTQSTSLSVMTTRCDGQQNCSIVVGNAAFTDPCPGTYKYLFVSHECILPQPPSAPSTNLFTCESETAPLSCAQGTIKVLSANYGRTDQTTCSTGKPAVQLSNVQCRQSTSLSVLTTQCDEKTDCSVSVNNAVFGEPCAGTYKYLNVSYTCVPTIIICQDKGITITCERNRQLNIHFANYGRRDSVTCPHSHASAMSSMCTSSETRNLQVRCNGKRRCALNASDSWFQDQCPHIHKYLEVSYSCD